MRKIILASKSPRRSQLLQWAEVPFEVITSDTEEDYPDGLTFEEVAVHIAKVKAFAVSKILQLRETSNDEPLNNGIKDLPVLAADTIVVLNERIIGKPKNKKEAILTLQILSGKIHQVITGVCILFREEEIFFSESTLVEFHSLTDKQIEYYVEKYKPYDKAGAYAIQEWIGVVGIKSIQGDYYNVMGLPVSRVIMEVNLLES